MRRGEGIGLLRRLRPNPGSAREQPARVASRSECGHDETDHHRGLADHQWHGQVGARLAVYRILAVDNPDTAPRRWAIFVGTKRVYRPENLYDCIRWRDRRIRSIIRGEAPQREPAQHPVAPVRRA